jgi:hypothetical protein
MKTLKKQIGGLNMDNSNFNKEIIDLLDDIVAEKKHLRLLKFTQVNHPHRAEDWDWAIEKSRERLAELSDKLFELSNKNDIVDDVMSTLSNLLEKV